MQFKIAALSLLAASVAAESIVYQTVEYTVTSCAQTITVSDHEE
jgi:hypothetical protein